MRITRWPTAAVLVAMAATAHAGESSNDVPYPLPMPLMAVPQNLGAHVRADLLLKRMTQDEKLQFIHSEYQMSAVPGGGAGYIQGVPRLGIPDLNMVDSATGSGSTSQKSTTFPATIALAASWDPYLARDFGARIADQLREQGFGMGLGGGTNLAREPRGGRLFEYLGEDPVLAGEMLAARTIGTQSQQVIATIKHYVGNEQETGRQGGNSQIDERTLRELYLLPFEIAAKEARPGSVMCSYNRLNGTYACENTHVLTDVLKKDWGFQGQVQSDWGATHSTAPAINAGLDEEEDVGPTVYLTPDLVKQAIASKAVSQDRLDDMVRRKLYVMISTGVLDHPAQGGATIDFAKYNAFTQAAEEQSIVLLKNDNSQLPLSAPSLHKIAVIGAHADTAVLTGGGSGNTRDPVTGNFSGCGGLTFSSSTGCGWWTNPWLKLNTPITQAIQQLAPSAQVSFAGNTDQTQPFRAYTQQEITQAATLASQSDVAIVVVAQPAGEDFGDLQSLSLANPSNQDQLVEAVAKANPRTIVIIESGNPVLMPWKDQVSAIVEAWYPGEGGGKAIANVLFGQVNPSGKLPVTFPVHDQDTPTWGTNGAFATDPVYSEKLDMGYRWYDANNITPLYEFGYGLSYTHFSYSGLTVKQGPGHTLTASFTVRNDGRVAGAETAQVYLGVSYAGEPPRRLVGFQKVFLKPGQSQPVRVTITERAQSVWDTSHNDWAYVSGSAVYVGASSRDIRLQSR
ncbi:glycoside hydrolase family 3 C-terminal domain-containing protein [Paraburkholderia sp. CNPSo 3076]|uniref:glycoside hydrolase family 3 C-terminal domain-containing protein n=1 Tax=Paraburkholderia sp. CNPSo 3076 TaxID=2940936 RepID=UPI002253CF0A|nr:glycoside hydrolase family 3 C-terminal domain-containing protein [Paraburkholderia sp. CNPSo 3076]MCX5541209.1 glycoside hydrolase family 3 C-terminal domain-containing protein [Paraburkholderia sp. CNPSo 3076]